MPRGEPVARPLRVDLHPRPFSFSTNSTFMNFETVLYTCADNVATIQMNRPEALNALSLQLGKDLAAVVKLAVADHARAVILTGSGHAFCSGGDLREMKALGESEGSIEAFLDEPLKALHNVIALI